MEGLGVIVEAYFGERESESNLSCSGLQISPHLVLTHGTILTDIFKETLAYPLIQQLKYKKFVENQNSVLQSFLEKIPVNIEITFPHKHQMRDKLQLQSFTKSVANNARNKNVSGGQKYHVCCSQIAMVFLEPSISETFDELMPESEQWTISETNDEKIETLDREMEKILLSSFVVLQILSSEEDKHEPITIKKEIEMYAKKLIHNVNIVTKGMQILVEGSPFGNLSPGVFLNSLSTGIVSNISSNGSVILSDARCVMGTEGAPVYASPAGTVTVVALVVSPFCWRGGEWLGLTLMASAKVVLDTLLLYCQGLNDISSENHQVMNMENEINDIILNTNSNVLLEEQICPILSEALECSVVGVECGGGWGSGVIVNSDPGIVITCAHVTEPSKTGAVDIYISTGARITGHIVHQTKPLAVESGDDKCHLFDIAVISTISPLPKPIKLAQDMPRLGCHIMSGGYGIFSPSRIKSPTLSHGIISKVVTVPFESIKWSILRTQKSNKSLCMLDLDTNVMSKKTNVHKELHNHYRHYKYESSPVFANNMCETDQQEIGSIPILLQTTCSVYSGTSGGPIVGWNPGHGVRVIGITVCNARDSESKATYPHINLAVPAAAISNVVNQYINTGDASVLSQLDIESTVGSKLWSLGDTPKSKL
ncbi:unnamed protein product [Meganyctiphanes norvegica]|uniref:Peroxisomal leader peptide-processing protease n=1 Tax=Meganyctiphanes norvegica TaxID=48144 RepID=A0AAV2RS37_MEGNR